MVFAARLTQRGHVIATMDDLLALYEKSFTEDTLKNIGHLPHPTVQKFAVITIAIVGASRRFLSQIMRHQNEVKFMSASLQYSNYSGKADFAVPYEILTASEEIRNLYLESCQSDMDCYEQLYEAGFAMHNSSGGRCRQKYCCPFKNSKDDCACTCAHKNYFNGKKNRGCVKYITLPDDHRLSIDRSCISFKKIYSMRTEIERYNARFKKTGQERMWVRSFNAVQNLSTLAHVALLAVAAAAVLTQKPSLKLSLKSSMRSA